MQWSSKRYIEEFNWYPYDDVSIDFAKAHINHLFICSVGNKIKLSNAHKISSLSLSGNIETIHFINPEQIESININNGVNEIFNCEYLLPFINLKQLNLNGNLSNLHVLKELTYIETLGLRYVSDLSGMPALTSWGKLKRFIAYVVEEKRGKFLKAELKQLIKEKKLPDTDNAFFSASKLKSKLWFMAETNAFFVGWSVKNEKKVSRAYKLAVKEVFNAKIENEVKDVIFKFIKFINTLSDIETTEREDARDAVYQLVKECHLDIAEDQVAECFDEVRDF